MGPELFPSKPGSSFSAAGRALRAKVARELGENVSHRDGAPPAIPDHTLLQRIGQGAYGEVWLARSALGTLRAVKIVYRDQFEDERPCEREFQGILRYEPISRSHEGLMAILHVGHNEHVGYFYYVMELADNAPQHGDALHSLLEPDLRLTVSAEAGYVPHTLRSELRRRGYLSPQETAELGLGLAGALAHLHRHGLVHRDVKPSNVIFIAGRAKLADLGLIAAAGDCRSFVGTEGFIPPEGPGTVQADIFGLGKLLYECASGRDRTEFPQLPSQLTSSSEAPQLLELNEILTRACAPKASERYRTAEEMSAELKLFLAGRSLRDVHQLQQRLWLAKHLAAVAAALLILLVTALWVSKRETARASNRAEVAKRTAEQETGLRQRAEAAEALSRRELYTALVEQARATVRGAELGQRVRALAAIQRAAAISNAPELRSVAMAALALPDLQFERELPFKGTLGTVSLDPTFQRVALTRADGVIEVHSTIDWRLLLTLKPTSRVAVNAMQWSADGRFLAARRNAAGSNEAELEIWDTLKASLVFERQNVPGAGLSFGAESTRVLTAEGRGAVGVWDLTNGREISRWELGSNPALLRFSPKGELFAAVSPQNGGWTVSVYQVANGVRLSTHVFPESINAMEWHPGGRRLALATEAGAICLMDIHTGETQTLGFHKAQAVQAVFTPDGHYLLSGGWDRELLCWDMLRLQRAFSIALDSFFAQFRSDGQECAIWPGLTATLQFYAVASPVMQRDFTEDLGGRVRQAAFSPDGKWLAASGKDRLAVWDLKASGQGVVASEGADARPCFSAQGEILVSGNNGFSAWRLLPGQNGASAPMLEPLAPGGERSSAWVCSAGKELLLTTRQGTRALTVGSSQSSGEEPRSTIWGVNTASPDGRWLAIFRPFSPALCIYRLGDLKPVATLMNRANIASCQFSSGGDEVAVASTRRVEFWSTSSWQCVREVEGFMGALYDPDGLGIWLTKDYRTAGLYTRKSLKPLLPLPRGMLPLALSPDGEHLAVSVDARRVQVWDLLALRKELRGLGLDWAAE